MGGVVCEECTFKVTEEMCYQVATYDYNSVDGSLWSEIASGMEKRYLFRDYSLELANYLDITKTCYGSAGNIWRHIIMEC